MKRMFLLSAAVVVLTSASVSGFDPNRISGSYVESRGSDVYIGACFANSQMGLVGKEGTMAWKITSGQYNGVSLAGQTVVAAIVGNSTIGDKFSNYLPVRSVLIYDTRATAAQRDALRAFVLAAAGKNVGVIVREEIAPVTFEQARCASDPASSHHDGHSSSVAACIKVAAGDLVRLETRNLRHSDNLCASPELFGQPLSRGVRNDIPVFVPQMMFRGTGLGATWSIPDTRGGFVADFELEAPRR
jgi:hypothetical protein